MLLIEPSFSLNAQNLHYIISVSLETLDDILESDSKDEARSKWFLKHSFPVPIRYQCKLICFVCGDASTLDTVISIRRSRCYFVWYQHINPGHNIFEQTELIIIAFEFQLLFEESSISLTIIGQEIPECLSSF